MIIAIIITSLIWLIAGLIGIIYLCREKEETLDNLYTDIKRARLNEEVEKRVLELLVYHLER